MYYSIFDLFKIGIGPSSSHTVAPIKAANLFIDNIINIKKIKLLEGLSITLQGSLAYTAIGHKTIDGIIIGLMGIEPENVDTLTIYEKINKIRKSNNILINSKYKISFNINNDIVLDKSHKNIENHSNIMSFKAFFKKNTNTFVKTYISKGGGFVKDIDEPNNIENNKYPLIFKSSKQLLQLCYKKKCNFYDIVLINETAVNKKNIVENKILKIWNVMNSTIKSGSSKQGTIDNILNVERRAYALLNKLKRKDKYDPLEVMDWVNIFAIATCEENASGSKIVTAPTNGAAGIIPAVLKYYVKFINNSNNDGIVKFIATSAAIGNLFKINSSISGAEVGCQGEVGVACSMAAAGLTASLGGTPEQIENAAEIGMEHNLGLTCDPIKGLVQIPCIERNSMGAIKAINASRLALNGSGTHKVTLDQVIKTMNDTGRAMSSIYKETALGGLAVNVIEC